MKNATKKIFAILLTVIMALNAFPMLTLANDLGSGEVGPLGAGNPVTVNISFRKDNADFSSELTSTDTSNYYLVATNQSGNILGYTKVAVDEWTSTDGVHSAFSPNSSYELYLIRTSDSGSLKNYISNYSNSSIHLSQSGATGVLGQYRFTQTYNNNTYSVEIADYSKVIISFVENDGVTPDTNVNLGTQYYLKITENNKDYLQQIACANSQSVIESFLNP